jgi:hypothetical protein
MLLSIFDGSANFLLSLEVDLQFKVIVIAVDSVLTLRFELEFDWLEASSALVKHICGKLRGEFIKLDVTWVDQDTN